MHSFFCAHVLLKVFDAQVLKLGGMQDEKCSLLEAFDEMQLCYTMIPQIKNYYRYGEWKDCSRFKDKFYVCLSTKTMPANEAKVILIYQRNRKNCRNSILRMRRKNTLKGLRLESGI